MNALRFDAWTRRRFGLAAGGMLAASIGVVGLVPAGAKNRHKRRRKRCRKLGRTCVEGGNRKCCGDLKCDRNEIGEPHPTFCCKREGKGCQADSECCNGLGCAPTQLCTVLAPSDRNLKANVGSVDPADMLQRVRELPISTWNYTSDDPAVRHIGPMAQDFAALFGVGADDRHIHPIDGQGVALAAIQGLLQEIEALREENARLAERLAALEAAGDAEME